MAASHPVPSASRARPVGSRSVAALAVGAALAIVAAGCGGGGSSSNANAAAGTTTGAGRTQASFQACLKAHGVTLPAGGGANGTPPAGAPGQSGGGTPPAGGQGGSGFPGISAKQRKALQACGAGAGFGRGQRGRGPGSNNAAFGKYTACLKSHGVTFGSTNSSSSIFKSAQKACNSLLPTQTTTTTP